MATDKFTSFLLIALISKCAATVNTVALISNLTTRPISNKANEGTGFVDLATKYGYKSESHDVTTEDGYILTLHRIPPAAHCEKKTPVYLLPNIHMTSAGLLGIADQSPGFLFADDCYDVWFGNLRGTLYGRRHVSLDPDKDLAFWKFHAHQQGVYDVPVSIDYILEKTGSDQLISVGFSHGSTVFYILCSEKPEYASKIRLQVSLAPTTRLINNRSLVVKNIFRALNKLLGPLEAAGVWEVTAKGFPTQGAYSTLCQIELLAAIVCGYTQAVIDAPHPDSLPPEAQQRVFEYYLAGTSTETVAHYGQLEDSKVFSKFDYGLVENLKRYGSATPPAYNLTRTAVPLVMFQGLNDHLVDVKDIDWTVDQLPNVIDYIKVDDPLWNHIDMFFSIFWKDTIYVPMKKYLEKYSKICTDE